MRIYNFLKITLVFLFISNATFATIPFYPIKKDAITIPNHIIIPLIHSKTKNKFTVAITPPVIKATGNQTYCPGSSIKIVETITITNDPSEPSTDALYIQISSGYVNGQDKLTLTGSHPSITTSWDVTAGKLKLYSPTGIKVPYTDFVSAVKDVEFNNLSISSSGIRNFSITIGQANYLPSTQHYYQFISNIGISWTDAKIAAEASTYYGIKGYLATVLALDEAQLIGEQAAGAGWIGGSDAQTEGIWKWVTGPEAGNNFSFIFWNNGEPNNLGDENYAHITAPGVGISGSWNDMSNSGDASGNYQPKGYIVEYGGMPGDPIIEIAASTTINIPKITGTTPNSICGSGTVTLQATATGGTINWYDDATGGSLLTTGNSFTTPTLSTTTTYYVDAGCPTARTPITATVYSIPTIISTNTPVHRCGVGSVTLEATTDLGTINWYSTLTGGTIEATGTSFTKNITQSTTYYAEAINNGCSNGTRTKVNIVTYTPPIVADQEVVLCKSGTVELDISLSGMSYLWHPNGETTQQIIVSTTGIYTADVTSPTPESCTSTKKFTVVEHNIPEINYVDVNETTALIYPKNPEIYFEYSVDGINYQSSNVFFNVPSGLQTAYVREINLCSYDTQTFIVLIIPKFFTPNNDAYNDFWEVKGLINYPEAEVTIFDRYGKFISKLNRSKLTWDGTFNNNLLPASDYWYVLKIDANSPEKRGHFSLKR
jgi:gliding motility-associated-like protein